jgi:hypothetical protein
MTPPRECAARSHSLPVNPADFRVFTIPFILESTSFGAGTSNESSGIPTYALNFNFAASV